MECRKKWKENEKKEKNEGILKEKSKRNLTKANVLNKIKCLNMKESNLNKMRGTL